MLKLGVNIDHVATLRQARYDFKKIQNSSSEYPFPKNIIEPNLLEIAKQVCDSGADTITIHLREDRRHIQDDDVYEIKKNIIKPLNLEMSLSDEIVDVALKVKPKYICLVPEKREELTTEGGLDAIKNSEKISNIIQKFKNSDTKISIFIEPNLNQIKACKDFEADIIELHTGKFSILENNDQETELNKLIEAAEFANDLGLSVNAGHGINSDNLEKILEIPYLQELNIGHHIISRSILVGIDKAIREFLLPMKEYYIIK